MPVVFSLFAKYPTVKYGFSTRADGSMHRHLEKSSREAYFLAHRIHPGRVVSADLAHGANVARVSEEEAGAMVPDADGLVTDTRNLFLSATAADCFLLYCYDQAVGIVHVGWRGLLAGIISNAVASFASSFETDPATLLVGIGPGIRKCHFEISPNDRAKYEEYSDFVFAHDSKVFVDLQGIIKVQLQKSGLADAHSEDRGACTCCNEREYFSYRRDKPQEIQCMVGYIGLI